MGFFDFSLSSRMKAVEEYRKQLAEEKARIDAIIAQQEAAKLNAANMQWKSNENALDRAARAKLANAQIEYQKDALELQKGKMVIDDMYRNKELSIRQRELERARQQAAFDKLVAKEEAYKRRESAFVQKYVNARQTQIAEGKVRYDDVVAEAKRRFKKENGKSPFEVKYSKEAKKNTPTFIGHDVESVKEAAKQEEKKKDSWDWSYSIVNGKVKGGKYGFGEYAGLSNGKAVWFNNFIKRLEAMSHSHKPTQLSKKDKYLHQLMNDIKRNPNMVYKLNKLMDDMGYAGDREPIFKAIKQVTGVKFVKKEEPIIKEDITPKESDVGVNVILPDSVWAKKESEELRKKANRDKALEIIDQRAQEYSKILTELGWDNEDLRAAIDEYVKVNIEGFSIDKYKERDRYVEWLAKKAKLDARLDDVITAYKMRKFADEGNFDNAVLQYAKDVGVKPEEAKAEIESMRENVEYVRQAVDILKSFGALSDSESAEWSSALSVGNIRYSAFSDTLKAKIDKMLAKMKHTAYAAQDLHKSGVISGPSSSSQKKVVNRYMDMQENVIKMAEAFAKGQIGWTYGDKMANVAINHSEELATWLIDMMRSKAVDPSLVYAFMKNQMISMANLYKNNATFSGFSDKGQEVLEGLAKAYRRAVYSVTDEKIRDKMYRFEKLLSQMSTSGDGIDEIIAKLEATQW